MNKNEQIEHEAIIKEIRDNSIIVQIASISACGACHAKKICSVSEVENKDVEVLKENNLEYKKGDKVVVYIAQKLGLKAVLLGYGIPFLLVMLTLILMIILTKSELLSGLTSIFVLVPYYFVLYLFKNKISKEYQFRIK